MPRVVPASCESGHACGVAPIREHRRYAVGKATPATRTVSIASIRVGTRYRKDMGDLQALADSLAAEGLIQPLAVTESLDLVAGERRLRAAEMLGWTDIAVHVVSVSSIVAGEYAENVIRKDFSVSERVNLTDAIRETIGNRQGARTDVGAKKRPGDHPEVPRGTETRTFAANLAGFDSDRQYRDARDVLAKGAPELVAAVDAGNVPISTAHELLKLDADTQANVVKGGRLRVQEAARELRRKTTQERERVVPRVRIVATADGSYPCTFPGCKRGPEDPYLNFVHLASHRTTAHGIRSTNVESLARQARRDRLRGEQEAAKAQAAGNGAPLRNDALDRGEREMLRKRIDLVCQTYAREIRKPIAEVYRALLELAGEDMSRPIGTARVGAVSPDRAFATGRT